MKSLNEQYDEALEELEESVDSFYELLNEGYCYEDLAGRGENLYDSVVTFLECLKKKENTVG